MNDFDYIEMIRNGWPVLSILAMASILSVTIIFERMVVLRNASADARVFMRELLSILERDGREVAIRCCREYETKPVAAVALHVLNQAGGRLAKERALHHEIQEQIREIETRIPYLGTIGSVAPFIGLFGTVMGIIRAFKDISKNTGGGPEVVSAGISEALITTALGLLVAIPAIIFYNFLINRVRRFAEELDLVMYDLLDKICPEDPS